MTGAAKRKGDAAEREVAAIISELTCVNCLVTTPWTDAIKYHIGWKGSEGEFLKGITVLH